MIIEGFLKDIREEVGYKFGSPWRYSDKSIGVMIPIIKTGIINERFYVTIEEANDKGVIFKDTGNINKVIVESSLKYPIFIRSGTALKSGLTQPRAVESSVVIIPSQEENDYNDSWKEWKDKKDMDIVARQEINVRCIYASKSIFSDKKLKYGGDVPIEVRTSLLGRRSQLDTWNAVSRSTHRLFATNPIGRSHRTSYRSYRLVDSDNLVGAMDEIDKFTTDVDEILKKVPLFDDQVGAVFMDMKDVVGLEMFDHPKSWEAIHKEVEKKLGESTTKEEENMFFKPDYDKTKSLILGFLLKLLEGSKKEENHGMTSTISIRGDGVIGEATTIKGNVIHLVGLRDFNN